MSDTTKIFVSQDDAAEVARKLLDAADDPHDVLTHKTGGFGFVVPTKLAEKVQGADKPKKSSRKVKDADKGAN